MRAPVQRITVIEPRVPGVDGQFPLHHFVTSVGSGPVSNQDPAPLPAAAVPRCSMDHHGVQNQTVSRFHIVGHNLVILAFRLNVGNQGKPGSLKWLPGREMERVVGIPSVSATDHFQRVVCRDWIERRPQGDDLPALNRPVGWSWCQGVRCSVPGSLTIRWGMLLSGLRLQKKDYVQPGLDRALASRYSIGCGKFSDPKLSVL